ncbi:hypothetical protein [Sphingomonas sp. 37zxx]|uniref:hypothetical protein n=1 Tax=Sphingomonas sp. 37zxx TaxID=1550073 RepID=UPI00053BF7A4|nr:hypothetical protein [Sphingomonas sp. 37zxx]
MQTMRTDYRVAVLATIIAFHLLVILALMATRSALLPIEPEPPLLALFEPVVPPPPIVEPPPPIPAPDAPAGPPIDRAAPAGPPLRSAAAPTAPTPRLAEPAPAAMIPPIVALPSPISLPLAPSTIAGTAAAVTDGEGGGDGDGIAAGGGGSGLGGGGAGRSVRYARAQWVRKPLTFEFVREWPRDKSGKRVEGKAYIGCYLQRNGRPKKCWVIDETVPGVGKAAIRLSRTFIVRHVLRNDEPLDVPVRIPVGFFIAKDAKPVG